MNLPHIPDLLSCHDSSYEGLKLPEGVPGDSDDSDLETEQSTQPLQMNDMTDDSTNDGIEPGTNCVGQTPFLA